MFSTNNSGSPYCFIKIKLQEYKWFRKCTMFLVFTRSSGIYMIIPPDSDSVLCVYCNLFCISVLLVQKKTNSKTQSKLFRQKPYWEYSQQRSSMARSIELIKCVIEKIALDRSNLAYHKFCYIIHNWYCSCLLASKTSGKTLLIFYLVGLKLRGIKRWV